MFHLQNVYGAGQSLSNPYTGIVSLFCRLGLAKEQIDLYVREAYPSGPPVAVPATWCMSPMATAFSPVASARTMARRKPAAP